ncbi:MAG: hypothetical protein MZU91_00325 [Desulfosudis oleivorans]|nr:hypothetical protein [Desulfosudis oleivorans]
MGGIISAVCTPRPAMPVTAAPSDAGLQEAGHAHPRHGLRHSLRGPFSEDPARRGIRAVAASSGVLPHERHEPIAIASVKPKETL